MKLRAIAYIVIGLVIAWIIKMLLGSESLYMVFMAVPIMGFIHELLHLLMIKIFRLRYKLLVKGFHIGFKVVFHDINQFVIAAIAPQAMTISFVLLFLATSNRYILSLALLHLAISFEDMLKVVRYFYNYLL